MSDPNILFMYTLAAALFTVSVGLIVGSFFLLRKLVCEDGREGFEQGMMFLGALLGIFLCLMAFAGSFAAYDYGQHYYCYETTQDDRECK